MADLAPGAPGDIVTDLDVRSGYDRDVSGLVAVPDGVARPRDEVELRELLRWAASGGTPLLPVGAQTSTTGASVAATGGLVVELQGMASAPVLDPDRRRVRVSAAHTLGELRSWLRERGFYLPVDPTSVMDCKVGGAVATNASGPSTFRYGATSAFVTGLRVVDGAGEVRALTRRRVEKCAMGPVALQEPIDFFIGSEGALGVITEVEFRVLVDPGSPWGLFVGFPTRRDLLRGVSAMRELARTVPIRAVEWLDHACCTLLRPYAGRLTVPEGEGGGLYVEVEGGGRLALERSLETAATTLGKAGGNLQEAQVLQDASSVAYFAELRHRVPDALNRRGAELRARGGGGKLSTDWSAPVEAIDGILRATEREAKDLGLEGLYAFGHIGNGHPHLNLLCPTAEVRQRALALVEAQLARVDAAGGVAVSEHGIGKVKRDLVRPYLPMGFVEAMRGLKLALDPAGILAPGNLSF